MKHIFSEKVLPGLQTMGWGWGNTGLGQGRTDCFCWSRRLRATGKWRAPGSSEPTKGSQDPIQFSKPSLSCSLSYCSLFFLHVPQCSQGSSPTTFLIPHLCITVSIDNSCWLFYSIRELVSSLCFCFPGTISSTKFCTQHLIKKTEVILSIPSRKGN